MNDHVFMKEAIRLSEEAVKHGNEPFGAVLVKDGQIVYSNENQIYTRHDPSFHAEAGLIRRFCAETGITDLSEYTLYSSCEPCFMCSGAMVWTKLVDRKSISYTNWWFKIFHLVLPMVDDRCLIDFIEIFVDTIN